MSEAAEIENDPSERMSAGQASFCAKQFRVFKNLGTMPEEWKYSYSEDMHDSDGIPYGVCELCNHKPIGIGFVITYAGKKDIPVRHLTLGSECINTYGSCFLGWQQNMLAEAKRESKYMKQAKVLKELVHKPIEFCLEYCKNHTCKVSHGEFFVKVYRFSGTRSYKVWQKWIRKESLINIGGDYWGKHDMERVYFNDISKFMDDSIKGINIDSAKLWFDIYDQHFYCKGENSFIYYSHKIIENIFKQIENEVQKI